MKYYPILKYKETIDIKAFNNVKIDEIIPIVELFQEKHKNLKKIKKEQIFYLNVLTSKNVKFSEAINLYIEIKKTHPNIIPIIDDSFDFEDKKTAMKEFKKLSINFEKLCFKINGVKNLYISDIYENLLLMVYDFNNTTLILDIDNTFNYSQKDLSFAMSIIAKKLFNIEDNFKNIIFAGAIVKIASLNYHDYTEGKADCIKNNLLNAVLEQERIAKEENYNINYADYTIDEKHIFTDDDKIVTTFYPLVKYTKKNGDISVYKSPEKNKHLEYKKIAKLIINKEADYSLNHCEGCKYISDIKNGNKDGKSTGNPSTWKTNMITHHIKTIYQLLNKRSNNPKRNVF